jgi:hypothetical protein
MEKSIWGAKPIRTGSVKTTKTDKTGGKFNYPNLGTEPTGFVEN